MRLLAEAGHSQKQIAFELGVLTRTIKRDWDKIRSYVKGQTRKEIRAVADARQKEFEHRYEGLTANEELHLLKQDIRSATKAAHKISSSRPPKNPRQQTLGQLDYFLDLDSPTADGFPNVIVPPDEKFPLAEGYEMKFYAIKNGEKRELFNINLSTKTASPFY